jgi:hypothetical protein
MNGVFRYFQLLAVVWILMVAVACNNSSKSDQILQTKVGNVTFPEPKFDKPISDLESEYKKKYAAKEVVIGRPFRYSSDQQYDYWLKVEFLNPELSNRTFRSFGKEVAINIFDHLSNTAKFDKIEISAVNKNGFILTFTKTQNTFFLRDSLHLEQ